MDLIGTLRAIASTGLSLSTQAARYTLYKTLLDRPYRRGDKPAAQPPGKLVEMKRISGGACFHFAKAELEIILLAPNLARLSWEPGLPPRPYALARTEWPVVDYNLRQEEDGYSLTTSGLQINVLSDGGLRFIDPQGRLLRCDYPPEQLVYKKGNAAWSQKTALNPGECLYGLGERAAGLDLRGGTYRLVEQRPGRLLPTGQRSALPECAGLFIIALRRQLPDLLRE